MNYQVNQLVQRAISGQESVYWVGQPNPVIYMRRRLVIFFFSLFWNAFTLFWIWAASGFERKVSGMGYAGIPFLIVGVIMFFSPFIAYVFAFRKAYAITQTRVLEFTNIRRGKFKEHFISQITKVQLKREKNHTGDLEIEFTPEQHDLRKIFEEALVKVNNGQVQYNKNLRLPSNATSLERVKFTVEQNLARIGMAKLAEMDLSSLERSFILFQDRPYTLVFQAVSQVREAEQYLKKGF